MENKEISKNKKTPNYTITPLGELIGHNGWVTSISATANESIIVSGSRDKTLIVWQLLDKEGEPGRPLKRLYGHEHFVEDVTVSKDGGFALSGSWDKTLRLWNLEKGECTARFVHHSNDVLSVSFSANDRQICSGSRDKRERNYTITDNTDWITCVAFSPKQNPSKTDDSVTSKDSTSLNTADKPEKTTKNVEELNYNFLVYALGNGSIKKFDLDKLETTGHYKGHDGPVTSLAISPDASLCASGGKDGRIFLWDIKTGQLMREIELGNSLVGLRFNPGCYWLAGACKNFVCVWDLVCPDTKQIICKMSFSDLQEDCTSLEWTLGCNALLCGFTDGVIRILHVKEVKESIKASSSEERKFSDQEFSESTEKSDED